MLIGSALSPGIFQADGEHRLCAVFLGNTEVPAGMLGSSVIHTLTIVRTASWALFSIAHKSSQYQYLVAAQVILVVIVVAAAPSMEAEP